MAYDVATRAEDGDEVFFDEGKFRRELSFGPDDSGMVDGINLRSYPPTEDVLSGGGSDTNRKRTATNVHRILSGVRAGMPIKKACDELGIPARTWYRWMEVDPQLEELLRRAQELGSHALAHECMTISDEVPADKEAVMKAKLRVETRLRIIASWNRSYYGEQVEIRQNAVYKFEVTHADTTIAPRAEDLTPDYDAIKAMDQDDPNHPDFDGDKPQNEQGGSPPSTG